MKPACKDCRYWWTSDIKTTPGITNGWCHRFPPAVLPGTTDMHPLTTEGDWCGEFSPEAEGGVPDIPHFEDSQFAKAMKAQSGYQCPKCKEPLIPAKRLNNESVFHCGKCGVAYTESFLIQ